MLPVDKARVGFYTYKLETYDSKVSENHGETSRDKKEILLFDNGNEEVLKETTMHECLHALVEDLFGSDKKEEKFIRLFSPRLMQFLRDNPELLDWLSTESEEGEDE